MLNFLKSKDLGYKSLFLAKPHIFLCRDHPLAQAQELTLEELADYPRLVYEQVTNNSFYFAEELH